MVEFNFNYKNDLNKIDYFNIKYNKRISRRYKCFQF
jgi:hypothetical protein